MKSVPCSALWIAHAISQGGRWVHGVGLAWLVWQLSHSPLWLTLVAAAGSLPLLPLAGVAGRLADRCDRRRLLLITQAAAALLALFAVGLSVVGLASPGWLALIALAFGVVNAIDAPALQALLIESGGGTSRAVARQSLVFNGTRACAPMVAVALIESGGAALCFALNAASFLPLMAVLARHRAAEKTPTSSDSRPWRRRSAALRQTLPPVAVFSLLLLPCASLLPALATGGLSSFGSMASGLGSGALIAALVLSWQPRLCEAARGLAAGGLVFCVALGQLAGSAALLAQWGWALLGGAAMAFALACASQNLHARAPAEQRGRWSALYLAALLGLMPFGQLFVGALAEWLGAAHAVRLCASGGGVLLLILMCRPQPAVGQGGRRCADAGAAQS